MKIFIQVYTMYTTAQRQLKPLLNNPHAFAIITSMGHIFPLILIGLSVGLSNFAASIAIGLSGVSNAMRLKIGIVFGLFETGMPIVGLVIGHQLANRLGGNASVIGGALLVLTGVYVLVQAVKSRGSPTAHAVPKSFYKLLLTGLALSIDNLIIGFSLGTTKAPLAEAVIVIGVTSVVLSLIGLELGGRLKSRVVGYSEELGGVILTLVGIAVATKLL